MQIAPNLNVTYAKCDILITRKRLRYRQQILLVLSAAHYGKGEPGARSSLSVKSCLYVVN